MFAMQLEAANSPCNVPRSANICPNAGQPGALLVWFVPLRDLLLLLSRRGGPHAPYIHQPRIEVNSIESDTLLANRDLNEVRPRVNALFLASWNFSLDVKSQKN